MKTSSKISSVLRQYKQCSNFERLKQIIQKMKPEERRIAKIYLCAFDPNASLCKVEAGTNSSKSARLFNEISENPLLTEEEARKKYQAGTPKSFDELISRLKEKVGYSLASELNTQRTGAYSAKWQASFDLLDKLAVFHIYYGRGLTAPAFQLLNKIISTAKEYELYPELLSALNSKREFLKLRASTNAFKELSEEINFYQRCLHASFRSQYWYSVHISYADLARSDDYFKEIALGLQELRVEYEYTKSATVGYILYYLNINYLLEKKDYGRALNYAEAMLSLINTRPAIYQPFKLADAALNLANIYLYLNRFDKTLENIEIAKKHFALEPFNYCLTREIEFYALFYSGKYLEAARVMELLLSNPIHREAEQLYNRRLYLYACVLFAIRDYRKCSNTLKSISLIHLDIGGWNIGMRFLSIMANAAYKSDHDLDYYKMAALKVHISSSKNYKKFSPRDLLIQKILNYWIKKDYNYKETYRQHQKDFDLLASDKEGYKYEIKSHELILFHEWFIGQMNNKSYRVDLSKSKELITKNIKVLVEL